MDFKLGFGPMSREVISSLATYSSEKNEPLMVIASRNQIDAESGYVMTTPELRKLLKQLPTDKLWICRDHCGPYFLDVEKGLPLREAVEASKKTIAYDIEQGFDLIHIDTSRVDDTYGIAEELFDFSYKKNPEVRFEFGTEENVGVAAGIIQYKKDVAFAKNMPNIYTVVAQTGSLCHEDHQAGEFNYQAACELVQVAVENGVKLKEHNADYLTAAEVRMRKEAGVHTLNIAPQLGVAQTKLLRVLSSRHAPQEWAKFQELVIASNRWTKWTRLDDDTQRVNVGGHYCFSSAEYRAVVDKLQSQGIDWQHEVNQVMYDIYDTYTKNLK